MNSEDVALPWSYWDDLVETELRINAYPYGRGIAQAGLQITLGRRANDQVMAVRLPAERARELAVTLLGIAVPGETPPFDEDPVAIRLGLADDAARCTLGSPLAPNPCYCTGRAGCKTADEDAVDVDEEEPDA